MRSRSSTKEGDLNVTRGCAWTGPGCHMGCGVVMYTDDDGNFVKCEGDPEDPWTNGRLCMRCLDAPEATNHKERLLYPMKRDPKDRGKDVWERITWGWGVRLHHREVHGHEGRSTAPSPSSSPRAPAATSPRTSRVCAGRSVPRTTRASSPPGVLSAPYRGHGRHHRAPWIPDCAQQFPERYDHPDYEVRRSCSSGGNYPLKSNLEGFYGHWVIDLMKRGMKIVTVDPKVTWLCL